ncbi:MAG: 2-hydroxyacyl-CoA dehydratase family protein [Pseudomonadota bacterium]
MRSVIESFSAVAGDSVGYARRWKEETGRPVIGSFPMNFPVELVHAAGALPVIIQEVDEPITDGEAAVFSFYCGYNRSVVDQALKGRFKFFDGIMFADHCVQLLGTADVLRWHDPGSRILFNQLVASMDATWAVDEARNSLGQLKRELEDLLGTIITDAALHESIALFNHNRQLIRRLYTLREEGRLTLSARDLQHVVKSSMVMDREDHTRLLAELVAACEAAPAPDLRGMPVYLSGHLCQAPQLTLLDLVESTGAVVVGDDLYHGFRYISTDVPETGDPLDALAFWYFERNRKVPCPTRADGDADWDDFLVREVTRTGAEGLIVLVAKFCEPHMYYFPEIVEACERAGIALLKLETEHDGMPLEAFKTRIETFVEVSRRRKHAAALG